MTTLYAVTIGNTTQLAVGREQAAYAYETLAESERFDDAPIVYVVTTLDDVTRDFTD
jgi:hypothetical protein